MSSSSRRGTAPVALCFRVEERYEHDMTPGAVVDVLRAWGHQVAALRRCVTAPGPRDRVRWHAFLLGTASSRPGPNAPDQEATA